MSTVDQFGDEEKKSYKPITKGVGVTAAEKYLARLCEYTFLSLWSYPCIYRDQGKPAAGGNGKEVCDLLVVFGNHVLIFSDKHCELNKRGNESVDWQRWYRKAIQESAQQAWGAERWIKQHPSRIFLDAQCSQPLPIDLPNSANARFHLLVVAHGISGHVVQKYGGSGSLLIDMDLKGSKAHVEPFHVGDIDPTRTFIHVLDDRSLRTLMSARDTISDFVAYLSQREKFLRGQPSVYAVGEEELLAIYLRNMNSKNEHDFVLPQDAHSGATRIAIIEGHWKSFRESPERVAQLDHDKISYLWDGLIERFNRYALEAKQYFVTEGGIKDAELVLRFMAREPRWKRRYLSRIIAEMLKTTRIEGKRLRVLNPIEPGDPFYLFLLFPEPNDPSISYARYREVRRDYLVACCKILHVNYPHATDIIGIATEPGIHNQERSEDAVYLDGRDWTPEMDAEAKELENKLGAFNDRKRQKIHISEYPELSSPVQKIKNPRNKPCPCGSGKKYKNCCLK